MYYTLFLLSTFLCFLSFGSLPAQEVPRGFNQLTTEAEELNAAGDFSAALQKAEEALLMAQEAGAEMATIDAYLLGSRFLYNGGSYQSAITYCQRADSLAALRNDFGRRADSHLWWGEAIWYLSTNEAALDQFTEAAHFAEQDHLGTRKYRGKYYVEQGHALIYLGDFERAESLIRKGLRMDSLHFGWNHANTASSVGVLAYLYNELEDYPLAIDTYLKMESIYRGLGLDDDAPNMGVVHGNLADCYFSQGRFDLARSYFSLAQYAFAGKLPPDHYNVLAAQVRQADAARNLGDWDTAKRNYALAKQNNQGKNLTIARSLRLGEVMVMEQEGDYERAFDTLARIAPELIEYYQDGNESGNIRELQGNCANALGRYEEARNYYEQALEIYAKSKIDRAITLARVDALIGQTYLQQGRGKAALMEAEKGLEKIWTPYRNFTRITSPNAFEALLDLKARALRLRNGPGDLEAALETALLLEDYLDYIRAAFGFFSDQNYLQMATANSHELLIDLYYQLGEKDPQLRQRAFYFSEKNKGFLLLQALRRSSLPGLENYADQQRGTQVSINYYQRKLNQAEPDSEQAYYWQRQLARERLKIQERATELKLASPALYTNLQQGEYRTVVQTQQGLASDEGVVEYFYGEDYFYGFLIGPSSFRMTKTKVDPARFARLDKMIKACATEDGTAITSLVDNGHLLYEDLLADFGENSLPTKLTIVPDGPLHYLPFEALLTKPVEEQFYPEKYPYLLQKHSVNYAYSATLLAKMKNRDYQRLPRKSILAMAPFTGAGGSSLSDDRLPVELRNGLPGAAAEVGNLNDLYGATALLGPRANLEAFLEGSSGYRIIHLSTHGRSVAPDSNTPVLYFSGKTPDALFTTLLMRDLYALELKADLVVLSSCQTNTGQLLPGEGVLSMARAFAFAGAKSTVTSLWSIDDASTQSIMQGFYANYYQGETKDQALRKAKLNYLRNNYGTNALPAYWAGMVSIGDPAPKK